MTTITSVYTEILDEVCSHLEEKDSYITLLALALTSRQWRAPAQRALFQSVRLLREPRAETWIHSAAKSIHHTKTLHLESIGVRLAERIVASCPTLRSLEIHNVVWRIGTREFDGGYSCCLNAPVDSLASLTLWSPLRPGDAAPIPFRLQSYLQLFGDPWYCLPTPRTILTYSTNTLTTLSLADSPSPYPSSNLDQIATFFATTSFPNLTTLWIPSPSKYDIAPWSQLISAMPSLVVLQIEFLATVGGAFPECAFEALATSSMPNLQILELAHLDLYEPSKNRSLYKLVQGEALPSLRRLDFVSFKSVGDQLPMKVCQPGPELRGICEQRGVEITLSQSAVPVPAPRAVRQRRHSATHWGVAV